MGNGLAENDLEPGKLYMKDIKTGVITEINRCQEIPLQEGENSFVIVKYNGKENKHG